MKVETPLGDVVDKITILNIKREKLDKSAAIQNVEKELSTLILAWKTAALPDLERLESYHKLAAVNAELWAIEDALRLFEKQGFFGEEFVQKARQVYQLNDLRSKLKRQINVALNSTLTEEKSHF